MRRAALAIVAAFALRALAACGHGDSAADAGAGEDVVVDRAPSLCSIDTRAQPYVWGMEQAGKNGQVKVKLLNIAPTPPGTGANRWNFELHSASGAAIAGAAVAVVAREPDFGVSPSIVPTVKPASLAGQYSVDGLDIPTPGVWTFTFDVSLEGGVDEASFTFCIDE